MNFSPLFILISSLLALTSPLIYIRAVVRGEARPHRTTRLVLLVITALTTAALFAQKDTVAIWLASASMLQSILVFILSLKYGMGGWGKLDLLCLGIALLGIGLWQTTQNPVLALYAAIAADLTGMLPTLIKVIRFPKTEIWAFFLLDAVAASFSLLAMKNWQLQGVAYPVYLLVINVIISLVIILPRASRHKLK